MDVYYILKIEVRIWEKKYKACSVWCWWGGERRQEGGRGEGAQSLGSPFSFSFGMQVRVRRLFRSFQLGVKEPETVRGAEGWGTLVVASGGLRALAGVIVQPQQQGSARLHQLRESLAPAREWVGLRMPAARTQLTPGMRTRVWRKIVKTLGPVLDVSLLPWRARWNPWCLDVTNPRSRPECATTASSSCWSQPCVIASPWLWTGPVPGS